MASMRKKLEDEGLLSRMVAGPAVQAFLTGLQIVSEQATPQGAKGKVAFGVVEQLGFLDLHLIPPNDQRDFFLTFQEEGGARVGFRLAVSLHEGPQKPLFKLISSAPGKVLVAAQVAPDGETLTPMAGATTQLLGTGAFLVLDGRVGGAAEIRLSPNSEPPDDVLTLTLDPQAALLGSSGFGFAFPQGLALDLSETAKANGPTVIDGAPIVTPADTPAWRGIVVRSAKFFLPKGVPFLGGHVVNAHVQVGLAPTPGIDLVIHTTIPAQGERPAIGVRIECRDPTATGLAGFVPTLVEMTMELPLDGRQETFTGGAFKLGAGKPVRVRATYARKPAPAGTADTAEFSIAVESQGPVGLVRIDSSDGNLGAKVAATAATLATALIAENDLNETGGGGAFLEEILRFAVLLSSFLERGHVVLHRAEFIATGGVLPVDKLRLKIDYSVSATVTGINVGVMSLQMQPNQPLRARVREVILTMHPGASGLGMIQLDYTKSSLEVEDPGGWIVKGPGSLFDVLGTRSGRGSMWIEVDLRFKLDLGPVKVSGVTVRATLDAQGNLKASWRGLEATIALAPMIDGSGAVHLDEKGWSATLRANIKPLNDLGALANVQQTEDMVKLALGVDLPGPIPLGNTGLGIYGLGGVFAANGKPAPVPPGKDPVEHQLKWDYDTPGSFVPAEAFSFGLEAVIGTAVDMGYTFSARTGIFITTPEFALRGALNGKFMGERVKITREDEGGTGIQAKGVIVVDPNDGVTIGIEGTYKIPEILEIVVPIGARLPKKNAADWYIHLGADGWSPPPGGASEGRERGPVRAILLPDLIGQQADAYIMFRGNGITSWPRGGPKSVAKGTFIAAFGFGFDIVMGVKPIVWADVFARADILISTNPMTLVGLGKVGGGLHVGLFSVGVDANVHVVVVEGKKPYFFAEVCGKVDLIFDTAHKCVKLSFNDEPDPDLPEPAHPLDSARGQSLVDDTYRAIAPLAPTRAEAATVWPDAIPLLTFTTAPKLLSLAAAQFPGVASYPESVRARTLGGDLLHYEWELIGITLVDATDAANELLVAGPMSHAWVPGKFGDAGGQAQPAELALLTPFGDLVLNAFGDAGASLPHKPLDERANICQIRVWPLYGWALGAAASAQQSGWRMPPDPLSSDPLQSQVRAIVELFVVGAAIDGGRMPLEADTASLLPSPFGFTQPLVHTFANAMLDDRAFSAYLDCGAVTVPPGTPFVLNEAYLQHELRIVADEPLTQAKLWLVVDHMHWIDVATGMNRVKVVDGGGQSWGVDTERDLGNGLVALRWRPGPAAAVSVVTVRAPAVMPVGVIALGGITATADKAALARNAATQAEAEKLKQAAQGGPPAAGAGPKTTMRCVLNAGKTYRLDILMRWSGTLYRVDDKGNRVVMRKQPAQPADGSTDVLRSYWFKTAKLGNSTSLGIGTSAFVEHMYKKRDLFDPDMLVRHLRGYEPAQSELHRFSDDPVRVHFAHDHVAALAGIYGFKLECGIRRLDAPEDEEPDQFISPILVAPQSSMLMTGPEKLIAEAYLKSPCVLPTPGVVLEAPVSLTRNVWYEVFVRATSLTPATVAHGRIPGVTFRTSRWGGGAEMMTALQFPTGGGGAAHGGAMIRASATLTAKLVMDDDAAFDAMLADLGLDGWPAATEPRISLLWRETGGQWRCAGVLLESPEPIHRPGRFHVDGLQLRMGFTAVTFDIRMRDRSGSRVLFATTAPFVPRKSRQFVFQPLRPPMLELRCTDLPIGKPGKSLQGWLGVPLRPSFAEEAA